MSAALATDIGITFGSHLPAGALRSAGQLLEQAYYPLLTLALLGGVIYVEGRRPAGSQPAASAEATATQDSV